MLDEPVYRSMRHWMLTQNPPDHTRLRGLVVQARRVEDMRPRIQQIVDAPLDRIAPLADRKAVLRRLSKRPRHWIALAAQATEGRTSLFCVVAYRPDPSQIPTISRRYARAYLA
jgi:cytochrome P450